MDKVGDGGQEAAPIGLAPEFGEFGGAMSGDDPPSGLGGSQSTGGYQTCWSDSWSDDIGRVEGVVREKVVWPQVPAGLGFCLNLGLVWEQGTCSLFHVPMRHVYLIQDERGGPTGTWDVAV